MTTMCFGRGSGVWDMSCPIFGLLRLPPKLRSDQRDLLAQRLCLFFELTELPRQVHRQKQEERHSKEENQTRTRADPERECHAVEHPRKGGKRQCDHTRG